jgi:hypothetical protein
MLEADPFRRFRAMRSRIPRMAFFMLVALRDIATIKPYQQNPRVNARAVDAVGTSIREFG